MYIGCITFTKFLQSFKKLHVFRRDPKKVAQILCPVLSLQVCRNIVFNEVVFGKFMMGCFLDVHGSDFFYYLSEFLKMWFIVFKYVLDRTYFTSKRTSKQ